MAGIKKKQIFEITINASRENVWRILWGNETYPLWTAPFAEGSTVVTNWERGGKVLFLDGRGRGMVSRISDIVPNEFMSFEHLGEVIDGVEDTESERVKAWAGATENYTLKTTDGGTQVLVEMDIDDEFSGMFENIWPKALAKLKEIAESQ